METLLVAGATVITPSGRAEALAIRGDRIEHVGTVEECRAVLGRVDEELSLDGGVVRPGFVDAHCHPVMYGQALSWVDCRPEVAPDIDTLVTLLAKTAGTAGGLVRGFGYEHRRLAERRHPTAYDLDRVATDREVYVMNASGHGGVVNTYALRHYGITAGTPDPEGGRIGRFENGEPNGELWDAACDLLTGPDGVKIGNHGPNFHLDEPPHVMIEHVRRAEERFLAAGVTTVGDAQVSRRELETYLRARDAGSLRLRVSAYLTSALLDTAADLGLAGTLGDDRLRIAGIKFYADGTLGGWTAYFPDGYAADCCHHGQLYHSPEEYTELVGRAHRLGLQTATHAQSPYAIGMVLDAVEKAGMVRTTDEKAGRHLGAAEQAGMLLGAAEQAGAVRNARHRIEHCGLPTDEQITRMAALGVIPVMQPQHHLRTGDGTITAIGELGHRYNPAGLCREKGVPVAFSSDAPVAEPNPLGAVAAAAHRTTVLGTVLGPEELRLAVPDGLRAHTEAGARALHRERSVGTLEAGKLADFVVLTGDPERDITVKNTQTWIGGRKVWPL